MLRLQDVWLSKWLVMAFVIPAGRLAQRSFHSHAVEVITKVALALEFAMISVAQRSATRDSVAATPLGSAIRSFTWRSTRDTFGGS